LNKEFVQQDMPSSYAVVIKKSVLPDFIAWFVRGFQE
jgi:hypothetical protein